LREHDARINKNQQQISNDGNNERSEAIRHIN